MIVSKSFRMQRYLRDWAAANGGSSEGGTQGSETA